MGCWSVRAAVSPSEPEFANGIPASVLRCLQARYMADTFYTNAGCTLVAMNPFKPVPQLYSPELMREYHAASQPQVRPPLPRESGLPLLPAGTWQLRCPYPCHCQLGCHSETAGAVTFPPEAHRSLDTCQEVQNERESSICLTDFGS